MKPDREKVIKELNDIHAVACGLGDDECYLNSIGIKQLQTLINDATELLRVEDPKVLSYEELEDTMGDRAVWYEAFLTESPCLAIICSKSSSSMIRSRFISTSPPPSAWRWAFCPSTSTPCHMSFPSNDASVRN